MNSIQSDEIRAKLNTLLREVIQLQHAQKGIIQFYDEKDETLEVVVQSGLGEEFLNTFDAVKAFDPTACGRALGLKMPIVIDDVHFDPAFFPFMKIIQQEHIRSARAIPIIENKRKVRGILSIYFGEPQHLRSGNGKIPGEQLAGILGLLKEFKARRNNE